MSTDALPEITEAEWEAERVRAFADYAAARVDGSSLFMEQSDGVRETIHFDGDDVHVKRVMDVEPVMEWCKERYNEGLANRHSEFRLVASFPWVIVEAYAKTWGIRDPWAMLKDKRMVDRMLADRDLSYFRTLPGNFTRSSNP